MYMSKIIPQKEQPARRPNPRHPRRQAPSAGGGLRASGFGVRGGSVLFGVGSAMFPRYATSPFCRDYSIP